MATPAKPARQSGDVQFNQLGDNEEWEEVTKSPPPPKDTMAPAPQDLTQSWLYTGGDGTASTVKDLRDAASPLDSSGAPPASDPPPDDMALTVVDHRTPPSPSATSRVDPPAPPPTAATSPAAFSLHSPLQPGRSSPRPTGKEYWMKQLRDCFSWCKCWCCAEAKKRN